MAASARPHLAALAAALLFLPALGAPSSPPPRCVADEHDQQGACNVCNECCLTWLEGAGDVCGACESHACGGRDWPGSSGSRPLEPRVHYSPVCMREGGWHDVAAAVTSPGGSHHVFVGCDAALGGWHHAVSEDLVHWREVRGAPRRVNRTEHNSGETVVSFSTPCSGFIQYDDDGVPCAGFRQCAAKVGSLGADEDALEVAMEMRCATDGDAMAEWGDSEDLFTMRFWRPIPYDPSKPWKDADGKWYMLVSVDQCNATTQKLPCKAGGGVDLWTSKALRGPGADWSRIGSMFATNRTVLKKGFLSKEFVTVDYIGNLPGDPAGGKTRVLLNNVGGNGGADGCCAGQTGYFIGEQRDGSQLAVDLDNPAAMSMLDWGNFYPGNYAGYGVDALKGDGSRAYSMARTFGSANPNMVLEPGRRVIVGWLSGPSALQSLPRDLALDADRNLVQSFVPELEMLRKPGSKVLHTVMRPYSKRATTHMVNQVGQMVEIKADFHVTGGVTRDILDFGIAVLGCESKEEYTTIGVHPYAGLVVVDGHTMGNTPNRAGPLLPELAEVVSMHVYVDNSVIEVIVNGRTALTVFVSPQDESCGQMWLYGVDGDTVKAKVETYLLDPAHEPNPK